MTTAGLLKREKIIQIAGVGLILSPICNLLMSFYTETSAHQAHWSWRVFWAVVSSESPMLLILWALTTGIGVMMLKGRRSSWMSVLVILFIFISYNIFNFKNDIHSGWLQPTIDLLVNIGLFALIYAQEFHQVAQAAALARIRNMRAGKGDGPVVEFTGVGPWARVVAVTETHISLRATGSAPAEIQERVVEFGLSEKITVKARYVQPVEKADGGEKRDYLFEFIDFGQTAPKDFNDWLQARNQKKAA